MSFSKNKGQEGKTGLVWGWYQWEGREHKERAKEGEYDRNMHSCMKIE
jgi:hypothetical protein